MDNPRPEKVAVVEEVRGRLDAVEAAVLTEYRGLTVAQMAELRRALAAAGGDYKVYKNTLVKLAVDGGRHQPLQDLLQGPTAIAFVTGEITAVAKALRDYARTNPALVVKGGMLGDGLLSAADVTALADLPSREVVLARLAGAIAAPLRQLAGLMQALPQNLAYGLKALIDQGGGVPAAEAPAAASSEETQAAEVDAQAAGAEPAGAEAAGADTAGAEPADTAGADTAGADTAGADTAGADTAGAEPAGA